MAPLRIVAVLLGAALSWLGLLASRNWPSVQMLTRVMRMGNPSGKAGLAKLVASCPADELGRVVILAIPAKMGTTWVGHITHQLISHGRELDPSRNLMLDSPYPEFAEDVFGAPLHELDPPYWRREPFASYPAGPITVRSHTRFAELVDIGLERFRLVTVLRDPGDTFLSMWRFVPGIVGLDHNLIPIENLVGLFSWVGLLEHMFAEFADFYERRHAPNVLVLFFDDLKEDLAGSVRRLAGHLPLTPPLTEAELQLVTAQSTHEYMTSPKVEARFNEMPARMRRSMMERLGLTEEDMPTQTQVVRKGGGKSGEGKAKLPESVKRMVADMWAKHVYPRTNCTSLDDMRLKFKAELEARQVVGIY